MISPAPPPTMPAPPQVPQYPPVPQVPENSEPPKGPRSTPLKRRVGQTPFALLVKSILRPILKVLYYAITGIRKHTLLSLIALVLLIISVSATSLVQTGQWPFGLFQDQYKFNVNGKSDVGGGQVKDWLYSLRDGDATTLSLLDAHITSNPPDTNQLVESYSEPKTHLKWKSVDVLNVTEQNDGTVDSFVRVVIQSDLPSGSNPSAVLIWHFVTISAGGQSAILQVNLTTGRLLS